MLKLRSLAKTFFSLLTISDDSFIGTSPFCIENHFTAFNNLNKSVSGVGKHPTPAAGCQTRPIIKNVNEDTSKRTNYVDILWNCRQYDISKFCRLTWFRLTRWHFDIWLFDILPFDIMLFDILPFNNMTFDSLPFDIMSFDSLPFDIMLFNILSFDKLSFDKLSFDKLSFDKLSFDKLLFCNFHSISTSTLNSVIHLSCWLVPLV
jgi:hypothetical protein